MKVRVRYAPSPTGLQHIGGVRTALFNYFFARSQGGSFILRIEDTDQTRYSDEALQDLYETLKWLGISCDEGPQTGGTYGPYVQSERFAIYQAEAEKLIDAGKAYRCYCSSERLEEVRQQQMASKAEVIGYDRHCRNLSAAEHAELKASGKPSVIRLKIPLEGKTTFHDLLMGDITRKNRDINPDPVLLKTDGFPTYHLANVIDDHMMNITHIMRAQEWIPSGALHVILYAAFGWEPPIFCHLPMVMGKDGQKLSKRHGSTAVREFREQGYLPEALINYVSLVGWSYDGTREFFTKAELEELFSLEKISKSPGVFDYKKLEWYNGIYIRQKSDEELSTLLLPYLQAAHFIDSEPSSEQMALLQALTPVVKERLKLLSDVVEMTRYLFVDAKAPTVEELLPKGQSGEQTLEALKTSIEIIKQLNELGDEACEGQLKALAESLEIKFGALFMPIRMAVTGSRVSPPLFDSIRLLGLEKALQRLERAVTILEQHTGK